MLSPAVRWEMVEAAQAKELARMTEERRLELIEMLGEVESQWAPMPDEITSGLVQQQAIFMRARRR